MTTQLTIDELEGTEERELGTSGWHRIEQRSIDQFAEATGDHQWIHVDPEAAAAGPFGGTIAHGYLSLSMLPMLMSEVMSVEGARMGVNYGIERVRFTAPVPTGSEVRLHAKLLSAERRGEGVLYRVGVQIEIRGAEKPALVGEVLYLVFA
ncbi:MAG TPA: MaoC family dehydratase [Gaiellaceae bacterium]|jgi:acyl dehydratase